MHEIELKLQITAAQAAALRKSAAVAALADGPPTSRLLTSFYYDTVDHALRHSGIALRLRRENRRWTQTVKKANGAIDAGLSMPLECETPVPGQTLMLSNISDDDLREEVIGISRDGLTPLVGTRFRRTRWVLTSPGGARVELALDEGEVTGGGAALPILEAELELIDGAPGDLYALAERIFHVPPLQFSTCSKSATSLIAGRKAFHRVSARRSPSRARSSTIRKT